MEEHDEKCRELLMEAWKQIADYLISKGVTIPVMCEQCIHHKESDGFHFCKALGIYSPDDSTFFCKYGKRGD